VTITAREVAESSVETASQDGSRQPLPHAMLAAFLAIQFALISGFWYRMLNLGQIDWPRFNGHLIAPKASDVTQYLLGYVASSVNGFIFGLIFIFLLRPLIPVRAGRIGNFLVGQAMGLVLSFLTVVWWIPANFPDFKVGAFSHHLGAKPIIGTFIWHAAFFLTLTSLLDAFGNRPWQAAKK
jgi:hypothetical protein